jgi:hypothetical protein
LLSKSSSLSSSNLSLYDDADDLIKEKHRLHSTHLHTRLHVSALKALTVKRTSPVIWQEIVNLEPLLLTFHNEGLRLQHKIYVGVDRAGIAYLQRWLEDNHVAISHVGMLILRALAFYKRFTTYDELFEFLKEENCGELMPDKNGLDFYPKKTKEEEQIEKNESLKFEDSPKLPEPQKPKFAEIDIDWLMQSRHWTREQSIEYLEGIKR